MKTELEIAKDLANQFYLGYRDWETHSMIQHFENCQRWLKFIKNINPDSKCGVSLKIGKIIDLKETIKFYKGLKVPICK